MDLSDKKIVPAEEKKEYKKPQLVTYGDISDLTRNITDANVVMDNPVMKT